MEKNNKNLNVPNLRFPEFSGEWERCKVKDFTKVVAGATPSTSNKEYWGGDIRWMNSGELNLKRVYEVQGRITQLGYEKTSTKIIPPQSVLIGLAGQGKTRGTAAINYIELCTNQSIASILPSDKYYPEFLYQNIESRYKELRDISSGDGGRGGLNLQMIYNLNIPYCSISEQRKIGDFLCLLDQRIETQRKIIEDLKKLKDAIRTKLFTSLESHCNEYDEIRNMLHYEQPSAYLVNSTEYSEDYPIPVLTANKAFILGYTDEEYGVYDKGDCIIFDDFTMDLKYVTFPFKIKSSAIKILTPRQNIDLYFIYEYFLYLGLVSEEHKRHYISEIESMSIIRPQLKEQRQISQSLQSLEMQVGNAITLQKLLAKQKQHLLSQMFI